MRLAPACPRPDGPARIYPVAGRLSTRSPGRHTHLRPRLEDGFGLVALPEPLLRRLDGEPGEVREGRVLGQLAAGQHVEPDPSGPLPGVAAEGRRQQVEGAVGDAGVDVDPAVVLVRVD